MLTTYDSLHFEKVCRKALLEARERDGIGTLAEKRLHNIIKCFVCDDRSCHEKRISDSRRIVADILCGNDIYEIQTGHLFPLRDKVDFYLNNTAYDIHIIHTIVTKKTVTVLDGKTGEAVKKYRSPKIDRPRDMIAEMYGLIDYLQNPRVTFSAYLIELDEFRIQKSPKRIVRYDKVPTKLCDILEFNTVDDIAPYLPEGLPESFTAKQFGEKTGYRGLDLYSAIKVFIRFGLMCESGKKGRAVLYSLQK